MQEYHKIQTVFKRDPETNYKTLLDGVFSLPCFEYLQYNRWIFTEKVDGMNIRVMLPEKPNPHPVKDLTFAGKTDKANLPGKLVERLYTIFSEDKLREQFPEGVCLYGEGYGAGIQKGGKYREDQDFVLFDVKVGEWWLDRTSVEDVAKVMDIDVVPVIGEGNILKMVSMCRKGIISKWGDFQAEGIVARPSVELNMRSGQRIITKLKTKDVI